VKCNKINKIYGKIKVPKYVIVLVSIGISTKKNVSEVCKACKLSYSTTIRLVWRMTEKEKWIEVVKKDNINYSMRLTPKGLSILRKIEDLYSEMGYNIDNNFAERLLEAK